MTLAISALSSQNPTLLPSRDAPYVLGGVYEEMADGFRHEIILDFGECYLLVHVDEDTDALGVQFGDSSFKPSPACNKVSSDAPWCRWVGKECEWTWVAVNQQGYYDTVLFSFDGIVPSVLLHAIGSSIWIFSTVREGN
jgi:hypothetical protein